MSFPVFLPSTCLEVRSSTQKSINDILIYGREIYMPTKRQITYTCEVKACLLTRKNVPMEDAISVLAKRHYLTLGRLPAGQWLRPPSVPGLCWAFPCCPLPSDLLVQTQQGANRGSWPSIPVSSQVLTLKSKTINERCCQYFDRRSSWK